MILEKIVVRLAIQLGQGIPASVLLNSTIDSIVEEVMEHEDVDKDEVIRIAFDDNRDFFKDIVVLIVTKLKDAVRVVAEAEFATLYAISIDLDTLDLENVLNTLLKKYNISEDTILTRIISQASLSPN